MLRLDQIESGWREMLADQPSLDYFQALAAFLREERMTQSVFPEPEAVFRALSLCSLEQTRVVILGQDPYHGAGQANGLAFSVNPGVRTPPSLKNIFREIESDLGRPLPPNGDLSRWANQGVLLLNSVLTVREQQAGSHRGRGWEVFTDVLIQRLSKERLNLVFLLWGNYARRKASLIDHDRHLVLESGHPSPLSIRFFRGNRHFSKANAFLVSKQLSPVNW